MKIAAALALALVACSDSGTIDTDAADLPLPWLATWSVASQACHTASGAACYKNFAGGPGPDQSANIGVAVDWRSYSVAWSYHNVVVIHDGSEVAGCLSMTGRLDVGLSAYSVCADGNDLVVASTWYAGTAQQCDCATVLRR